EVSPAPASSERPEPSSAAVFWPGLPVPDFGACCPPPFLPPPERSPSSMPCVSLCFFEIDGDCCWLSLGFFSSGELRSFLGTGWLSPCGLVEPDESWPAWPAPDSPFSFVSPVSLAPDFWASGLADDFSLGFCDELPCD